MKSQEKAIEEAKKMSLEYGEMAVVFQRRDGAFSSVFYNEFLGEDEDICFKYVAGQLVEE
jgi:hypothetical protein